jgi:hypothetical protein
MAAQKFVKTAHLKAGPLVLTITGINPSTSDNKTEHATIAFRETKKRITLTRRRASLLVQLFGENIKSAIGRQIELFRGSGRYKGVATPFVDFRAPYIDQRS